ncbi:hypothetical protein [Clostridium sp.]|uniref:hypothetical protein n=1 Tax=Clostridium sp. TaxID=1506 RepID=UPI0026380974|nr:hypothetical protein [Clostridium sp.]
MEINKIYEISFLDSVEYNKIISTIQKIGNFSMVNNNYYIATKFDIDKIQNLFKKHIKTIKEITINNYMLINSVMCQRWCYEIFEKNKLIQFEKTNQEYLKKINGDLDYLLKLKKEGKLDEYLTKLMNELISKNNIEKINDKDSNNKNDEKKGGDGLVDRE